MADYVDGFVVPVKRDRIDEYREIAAKAGAIWREFGALDYKECVGDDLKPSAGGMSMLPFPKMAKVKAGETVVFSYVGYKSRAHRDAVNKKVMKDPLMTDQSDPMPFDMKRMAYGGFKVIVSK